MNAKSLRMRKRMVGARVTSSLIVSDLPQSKRLSNLNTKHIRVHLAGLLRKR